MDSTDVGSRHTQSKAEIPSLTREIPHALRLPHTHSAAAGLSSSSQVLALIDAFFNYLLLDTRITSSLRSCPLGLPSTPPGHYFISET